MSDEMRVKYLFINLKYPAYVKLQMVIVAGWFIGALLCFLYAKDSPIWVLKNSWWLCVVIALLEVGESFLAIGKAKRDFRIANENSAG